MTVKFYCAYASDALAVSAITRLSGGVLEARMLEDGEPVPQEGAFFYTDLGGHFRGHHLRHVRVNGTDKVNHLTLRGFKIPEQISAAEVIALRPIRSDETTIQMARRQRGINDALNLVHFTFTQERINGFRSVRERKRSSFSAGGWRSGYSARKRSDSAFFACS